MPRANYMTESETEMSALTYDQLKLKHRAVRDAQPLSLSIRIHRALSWLRRAEMESEDSDAQFIFLWIALNAAYATEFGDETAQLEQFRNFINKVLAHDTDNRIHDSLFEKFHGPIRNIFENKYLFQPFWNGLRAHDSTEAWKSSFATGTAHAMKELLDRRTTDVICRLCSRLYVLRNQLIHGGATYNGDLNRDALNDANRILETLIPIVIDLMIALNSEDFGELAYPPN